MTITVDGKPVPRERLRAPKLDVWRAIRTQARTINAVIVREMILRNRTARLSFLSPMVEPLLVSTIIIIIKTVTMRTPDYGFSMIMFVVTGFVPFYIYTNVSVSIIKAFRNAGSLRQIAQVSMLDMAIARSLLEAVTLITVAALGFGILAFFGQPAVPIRPFAIVEAIGGILLLALGMGLINGVIARMYPAWGVVYGMTTRGTMLLSGIFILHDTMREPIRTWMSYNPLLHGVEKFRTGFYQSYPTASMDIGYLYQVGFVIFVLGLCVERVMRRRVVHGGKGKK
jgi:capsular polysaccharide transport system permease protein